MTASIAHIGLDFQYYEMIDGKNMIPCGSNIKRPYYRIVAKNVEELDNYVKEIQRRIEEYANECS
jgi:hypothetical protein